MTTRYDFTTERGVPMRVVLLSAGEANPNYPSATSAVPTVEFYDRRYQHTPDGQFTGGRYTLASLNDDTRRGRGLALYGHVQEWSLNPDDFRNAMVGVLTKAFLAKVLQEQ